MLGEKCSWAERTVNRKGICKTGGGTEKTALPDLGNEFQRCKPLLRFQLHINQRKGATLSKSSRRTAGGFMVRGDGSQVSASEESNETWDQKSINAVPV